MELTFKHLIAYCAYIIVNCANFKKSPTVQFVMFSKLRNFTVSKFYWHMGG